MKRASRCNSSITLSISRMTSFAGSSDAAVSFMSKRSALLNSSIVMRWGPTTAIGLSLQLRQQLTKPVYHATALDRIVRCSQPFPFGELGS
jgi:hypothetical protein